MSPDPCPCGKLPSIIRDTVKGIHRRRVECACGRRGATLIFTDREKEALTEYIAVDGWNLGLVEFDATL